MTDDTRETVAKTDLYAACHACLGRLALLHALAHIEFNAINLALDAAYRFRQMPHEFATTVLSKLMPGCGIWHLKPITM